MSDAGDDTTDDAAPLRWWVEIGLTVAFYVVYSAIRNQFCLLYTSDAADE